MLRISAKTGNMAARLRPAKTSAIRREAPPVAEDGGITVRSAISAPPPFRRLHCSGQKQPNSLVEPKWSDTTAAGCGQVCRARPCCHRVAALALRSAVVESEKLAVALSRRRRETRPGIGGKCGTHWLCGGVGMREHLRLRCSQAARLCLRFASGTFTQHILCVTLRSFIPGAQGTRETLCWK